MIARLARQALGSIVSVFAVLGFAFVPLGDRTGFEHAKAIMATPEATRAVRGLVERLQTAKEQAWKSEESQKLRTPHRREPTNVKLAPTRASGAHGVEPAHQTRDPTSLSSTSEKRAATGSAGAAGS